MADIKVSELTEATIANNADYLYLVQSGASKKANVATVVANSRIDARVNAAYLAHLSDVSGLVPANGQVLTYNTVTEAWEPQSSGGIAGLAGVGASSGTGFVSNVQLAKALNSQFIGNVTLTTANVNGLVLIGNSINFHNKFTGTSFYWVEDVLGRDGYWAFNRNFTERAYITADGFPVNDAAAGQNTIPTFRSANTVFVATGATGPGTIREVGNLSLYYANARNLVIQDNSIVFGNAYQGLSLYWLENAAGGDGYWAFERNSGWGSLPRAYISVSGYPITNASNGANTLVTAKYGNVAYVKLGASGTGSIREVGNLSLYYANVRNLVIQDNAINFSNAFEGTSLYWVQSALGKDGYWAFTRNSGFGSQERAFISVDGYPVNDATAGANSLVTAKYGNVGYIKNDGGLNLTEGSSGIGANVAQLRANILGFRYGNHTDSAGGYFYNDRASGGFSYIWAGNSLGVSLDGVHFNAQLLENPSGTTSDVYRGDGSIGAVPSDIALKRNIVSSTVGLDFIKSLDVKSFEMKNSTRDESRGYSSKKIGFIAQDLYNAANNYVDMSPVSTDSRGYLGIDVSQVVAALVNAVKTLSDEIDQLKNR